MPICLGKGGFGDQTDSCMDDPFASWSWDILLYAGGLAVIVFLFMGPAMWSSTNEFMLTRLWRHFRTPAAKSHAGEDAHATYPRPRTHENQQQRSKHKP